MRITLEKDSNGKSYPKMHGETMVAKIFNKRVDRLREIDKIQFVDFELVTTILLEILIDDLEERSNSKKVLINKKKTCRKKQSSKKMK